MSLWIRRRHSSPQVHSAAIWGVDAGVQSASAETSGSNGEPAKNADVIVVWRPDRSRIAQNCGGSESKHSTGGTAGHLNTEALIPVPGRKWTRDKKKHAELRSSSVVPAHAAHTPKGADRPDSIEPEEKHRQRARNYDMPRLNTTTVPQHNAKVDPNSPSPSFSNSVRCLKNKPPSVLSSAPNIARAPAEKMLGDSLVIQRKRPQMLPTWSFMRTYV